MYPQSPFTKYPDIIGLIGKRKTEDLENYLKWLCETPKISTIRINTLKTTSDEIKNCISNAFNKFEHLPIIPKIEYFNDLPEVILIPNFGQTEMDFAQHRDNKEIIVDAICGAAILRGAHIYAPGVLAMQSGTQIDEIVNVYADIESHCKKGTNTIYQSERKLFLGIGCVKMQRYQLYGNNINSSGIAIEMIETISGVPSIGDSYLENGKALLQNLPSIVCGRVLDPKPNEIVLDMCAAPGNKTTHLAQLMKNCGILIALDKSEKRLNILQNNVEQFGLTCVTCYTFDASKSLSVEHKLDGEQLKPPFPKECFDKILLDAPCSGVGNRPLLSNNMTIKMQSSYPILQKKLLSIAVELLKVGGILVYSTCTIFKTENEENVRWLLDKYSDCIDLIAAEPFYGGPGFSNVGLSDAERVLVQRFGPDLDVLRLPAHNIFTDTVGFFIAKFIKKKNTLYRNCLK